MPETGRGVVVLVEALLLAQRDDGIPQSLGLFLVAVARSRPRMRNQFMLAAQTGPRQYLLGKKAKPYRS